MGVASRMIYMIKVFIDCDCKQVVCSALTVNARRLFKIIASKNRMIVEEKIREKRYRDEIDKIYPKTMNTDVVFGDLIL
jgi:hypothetical protein